MRVRTLLILLIIAVLIVIGVYGFLNMRGSQSNTPTPVPQVDAGEGEEDAGSDEPGLPPPTPTPAINYVDVVVARARIPIGTRISADLVQITQRPETNIAVLAGVTFAETDQLVGQIARTHISEGQEILSPMLAVSATALTALGSDLSLYVDEGRVAVAFPIYPFSGLAYALRPGDKVDVMMSLSLIEIDPEFRSALPNLTQRVDQEALLEGRAFLFSPTTQGRLELIPTVNLVAEIAPGGGQEGTQRARQVTQLTIQQAEVVWVGTWNNQGTVPDLTPPGPAPTPSAGETGATVATTNETTRQRLELRPDVVILSMPAQDALALKLAQETGINIDLALRSQGDNTFFATTGVSLPERVELGGLTIPEPGEYDLEERFDEAPVPFLPPAPPRD